MRKRIITGIIAIIIHFGLNSKLYAQEAAPANLAFGANGFHGFVFKHSNVIGHLIEEHPSGFELYLNRHTTGRKYWEKLYNYPDVGWSLSFFEMKTPQLGEFITAVSYMEFYLNNREKNKNFLKWKIGTGFVYATEPYDAVNNNKNNVVSTALSYTIQTRMTYDIRLSQHFRLQSALGVTHFSNGSFQNPNKGINIVTANLGFSRNLYRTSLEYKDPEPPELDSSPGVNITLMTGLNETSSGVRKKFPFLTISAYVDKRMNHKSALSVGIDAFYMPKVREEIKNDVNIPQDDNPDFKRLALTVGHELFVSRFSVLTQVGAYVYSPYPAPAGLYQRYGLKYYFTSRWFTGIYLKSHYADAEAGEWVIGIRL